MYRCIRCGYLINEQKGITGYHKQVLVAKPSVISNQQRKRYLMKDNGELSRSETLARINESLENPKHYDRDSMLNPNKNLMPGMSDRQQWMSADYANMDTDAVTPEKRDELNKLLKLKRYSY